MIAIDFALARRLALSVVLGQAAVTVICALAAWLISGPHAALCALLGGGISTSASLVMALLGVGGRSGSNPERALRTFFVGETAKIAVMIALFVAVLKTTRVAALPMLGTYVATFFVFWVALANALPPLGGAGRGRDSSRRSRGPVARSGDAGVQPGNVEHGSAEADRAVGFEAKR